MNLDIKRTAAVCLSAVLGCSILTAMPSETFFADPVNMGLGASSDLSIEYRTFGLGSSEDLSKKIERPDAPANLTAVGRKDSVVLTWDEADKADAYRIYKYNKENKKFEKVKTVTGTTAVVKDLEKGSQHFKVMSLVKYKNAYLTGGITEYVTAKVGTSAAVKKTNTVIEPPAAPSSRYTGFVEKDGKKYYFRAGHLISGKLKIDGDYYYFDRTTYAAYTSTWLTFGKNHCYAKADGRFATAATWIDGKLYRFDIDGVCTNYSTAKDTATVQKENAEKIPPMPKGSAIGFSGSGSKYTYTCTITEEKKIKKKQYEFASVKAAKDMVIDKLDDLRMMVVGAGYEVKLCPSDPEKGVFAVLSDTSSYSAYYDVFYNGEQLYRYHESYTLTYKANTKTVTKVTGKVEWGKPSSIKIQVKKVAADKTAAKKQAMPSGKTAGFTGSGTKFTYTANVTQKIKDKTHDFGTSVDARDYIMEKFGDYRVKVLSAGYTVKIAQSDPDNDFYATESDNGYYSAFYDVFLNGKKVYRYHEYYKYTYKSKTSKEVTKVVGTIEWKAVQ